MNHMDIPVRKVRLDDEVWEHLATLPGKTPNDKLRALFFNEDRRLDEVLELVQSIAATIEEALHKPAPEQWTHPNGAPNVAELQQRINDMQGRASDVHSPPPCRESGNERMQRERQEKQERTAALDSVDDPSIDRSDEFVSG